MFSLVPRINLLVRDPGYLDAIERAVRAHKVNGQLSYSVYETSLRDLDPSVKSDLIVSPANSYALMDGGFDEATSRCLSPADDYAALLRHCQRALYRRYRGFQPPGSALIIELPEALRALGRTRNAWGVRYVGHCPTMRVPDDVRWDREVVYECVWTLLCEIGNHNREVAETSRDGAPAERAGAEIRSILITPLATCCGQVSAGRWAQQAAMAIRHYVDAVKRPQVCSQMDWPDAERFAAETQETHEL